MNSGFSVYSPQPPHVANVAGGFAAPSILMSQTVILTSQPIIVLQPIYSTVGQENVQPPSNCPPGWEYLKMVNRLLVHQQLEANFCFESKNAYHIKNTFGQDVFFAGEESESCNRNCYGSYRSFDLKIFDNFQNEVIHMYRPLIAWECCSLQRMEVFAPPGILAGTVQEECSIFYPTLAVKNASGETMLRIEGPLFTSACGKDVTLKITSADGKHELGKITKQWGGFVREMCNDPNKFEITFPIDLDVKMKAVLLGGLFLIDMMFYETF